MGSPITYNTTADVFHGATGPGTPDITAIDIQLVPLGLDNLQSKLATVGTLTPPIVGADFVFATHLALMTDDVDVRDSWDPLTGWTGVSDHLWVPNDDGVCYTVLLVDMLRDTKTGIKQRRAWLMRQRVIVGAGTVGLGWPQQGI